MFLGNGVVANVNLKNTYGNKQNPLILIAFFFGFCCFCCSFITSKSSGAHLNPAVTLGLAVAGKFSWNFVLKYLYKSCYVWDWLTYIFYIDHYRITEDEETIRGTFWTAQQLEILNNLFSETLGTFVLVFGVLFMVSPNIQLENNVTENFGLGSLEALIGILIIVIGMTQVVLLDMLSILREILVPD